MWENALEKLKILNYEAKFCSNKGKKPFNRVHFIVPAANASNQFDDFVDVCAWLFLEITKSTEAFKREQFDDPTTVVNKLVLGLRQLDFRSSFPSQKLKTPFGEPVCTVLEFLTDKALESKGFKYGSPVYLDSSEVLPAHSCYYANFELLRRAWVEFCRWSSRSLMMTWMPMLRTKGLALRKMICSLPITASPLKWMLLSSRLIHHLIIS
jgi:hypothetical protein